MPARPLGAVVIGTGFGCFTHVRALRAAGFEVKAVVGRDPDKTARRAHQFDVPLALTSMPAALELGGVEAVTIATPPRSHCQLVLDGLAAGKHVICEKPLASDTIEARRMLAAAEAAGVVHLTGTEFRWDPGQATLARVVASRAIGEPRLVTFLLHVAALADPAAELPDWWTDASSGGGWLGAHGSQVIDQVRATLGDFDAVNASLLRLAERSMTADDAFVVHFRLESGAVGVLQSTAADWGPPIIETRIVGSRGTAWIDGLKPPVWVADRNGTRQVPVGSDLPVGRPEPPPAGALRTAYERMIGHGLDVGPYTRLAEAFRDRILGVPVPPSPQPATFAAGVAAMAVLDAVRRSDAIRTWVPVEG